ncbi:MAG: TerC family protein [Beijerinckiaceae bacterium]
MFEWVSVFNDPANWAALVTLIAMEVVLGIDNLLFISILTNKLPEQFREKARMVGISAALIMRLVLLSTIFIIVQLTYPVFSIFGKGFSWRDMILIAGGLFLLWKATKEIHHHVEHVEEEAEDKALGVSPGTITFGAAIFQILLLDLVFSVDSIITAVGMTEHISLMVIAVLVSIAVMLLAANPLANFINANPTIVVLALAFLMMIGMILVAEGFGVKVPKGYVYTAMAFAAGVEGLNMLARRRKLARLQADKQARGGH